MCLTFEELEELKRLAVMAQNFELAANVLQFIKQEYPNEQIKKIVVNSLKTDGRKARKIQQFKSLNNSLIRCGGKTINLEFMENIFPTKS